MCSFALISVYTSWQASTQFSHYFLRLIIDTRIFSLLQRKVCMFRPLLNCILNVFLYVYCFMNSVIIVLTCYCIAYRAGAEVSIVS